MEKTPQQQGEQGTLVDEGQPLDEQGHQNLGNSTHFTPGGSDTPQKDSEQMSHGQETYPGARPSDENRPGFTPLAGDVDPGDTQSAEETGQDGDLTKDSKKKAISYN